MWVGGCLFVRPPCCSYLARFNIFNARFNSLWVCDRHLQDEVFRDLKQLRVVSVGLQQEGQDIKTTIRSLPPQLHANLPNKTFKLSKTSPPKCIYLSPHLYLSKLNIRRVSQDLSIRLLVASVTNQLTVPHPKIMFTICPLGEDGDGRPASSKQNNKIAHNVWFRSINYQHDCLQTFGIVHVM